MNRRYPNTGKPPRNPNIPLGVQWRNGQDSKWTFFAPQLRWSITGHDFDVGRYWRTDVEDREVV